MIIVKSTLLMALGAVFFSVQAARTTVEPRPQYARLAEQYNEQGQRFYQHVTGVERAKRQQYVVDSTYHNLTAQRDSLLDVLKSYPQ